jgi:hypothetical protein
MKSLFAAFAGATLLAGAGAVSAQMYQPANPAPPMYQQPMNPGPMQPMQRPTTISGTPSWMRDDGSSSDHPIHNPGDISGARLNSQYQGGLTVPPGQGFPAMGDQR